MVIKFRKCRGAAAVEAALIFSFVLFPLVFGIIEFGFLLYNQQVITNASREGARAGIIAQNPRVPNGEITQVVDDYCKDHLVTFGTANDPVTQISREGTSFGDDLTITVTYNFGFLVLPNFVADLGGGRTLTATTVMKME